MSDPFFKCAMQCCEGYCEHVCSVAVIKIIFFFPFMFFLNGRKIYQQMVLLQRAMVGSMLPNIRAINSLKDGLLSGVMQFLWFNEENT